MVSEGERRVHPTRIDQHFLIREEAGQHGEEDLRTTTDTDGEYHMLVPDG